MKFCKDCKHKTIPPFYGFGQPLICSHPRAPIDPVTGDLSGSCNLMRSTNCCIPQCGSDGDWFEQAPPKAEPAPFCLAPQPEPVKFSWFKRVFGG